MSPRNEQGTWKVRRRIIHGTLGFCAAIIARFTLFDAADTAVNQTLVLGAFALAGSTIGAYVFRASWEDVKLRQIERGFTDYGPYPSTPYDDRPR